MIGATLIFYLVGAAAVTEGHVVPCEEGMKYPYPGSCSTYLECREGVTTRKDCPEGGWFDDVIGDCRPKSTVSCPRKCVEYESRPVEDNCVEYEICLDGEMKKRSCEPNTYYNRFTNKCTLGDPYTCFEICYWKGKKRVKDSCTEYEECIDNRVRRKACPSGNKFDEGTGQCRSSSAVDCQEVKCEEQEKRPAEFNCYSFEQCIGGKFVKKYCEKSRMFDKTTLTCKRFPEGFFCSNMTEIPEDVCVDNGKRSPVDGSCVYYEECVAGKLRKKKCPDRTAFDRTSGDCKPSALVVCPTSQCKESARRPSSEKCSPDYEECRDGSFVEKTCRSGRMFDAESLTCRRPSELGCTRDCEEGEKRPIAGMWDRYEKCREGRLVEKTCGSMQRFDSEEKECVVWMRARPAKCEFGEAIPVENSCTDYLQCSQEGKFEGPLSCGAMGDVYDEKTGGCRPRGSRDCKPPIWRDGECAEGTSRTVDEDCAEYEECVGGKIAKKRCEGGWPFGKRWDVASGECKMKWKVECPQCVQNDRRAVEDSCTEFEECHRGVWARVSCGWPGAVFDGERKRCVEPWETECRWRPPVDDSCGEGEARPVGARCDLYDQCQDGLRTRKRCAFGLGFDRQSKTCVAISKARCQTAQCSGSQLQPDYEDCSNYYQCDAGLYVHNSCPFLKRFDVDKNECIAGLIVECAEKPIF